MLRMWDAWLTTVACECLDQCAHSLSSNAVGSVTVDQLSPPSNYGPPS